MDVDSVQPDQSGSAIKLVDLRQGEAAVEPTPKSAPILSKTKPVELAAVDAEMRPTLSGDPLLSTQNEEDDQGALAPLLAGGGFLAMTSLFGGGSSGTSGSNLSPTEDITPEPTSPTLAPAPAPTETSSPAPAPMGTAAPTQAPEPGMTDAPTAAPTPNVEGPTDAPSPVFPDGPPPTQAPAPSNFPAITAPIDLTNLGSPSPVPALPGLAGLELPPLDLAALPLDGFPTFAPNPTPLPTNGPVPSPAPGMQAPPSLNMADSATVDSLSLTPQGMQAVQINNLKAGNAQINLADPAQSEVTVLDPEILIGPSTGSGDGQSTLRMGDVNLAYQTKLATAADSLANESGLSPSTPTVDENGLQTGKTSGSLGNLVQVSEAEANLSTGQMNTFAGQTANALRSTFTAEGISIYPGITVDDAQLLGRQSLAGALQSITGPTDNYVNTAVVGLLGEDNPISPALITVQGARDAGLAAVPPLGADSGNGSTTLGSNEDSNQAATVPTPDASAPLPGLAPFSQQIGEGAASALETAVGMLTGGQPPMGGDVPPLPVPPTTPPDTGGDSEPGILANIIEDFSEATAFTIGNVSDGLTGEGFEILVEGLNVVSSSISSISNGISEDTTYLISGE